MKPFEVALFKHFIESKGMVTVYINTYRKRHLKTNPISIEEFLATADVNDVCSHAFYFVINERWGYDYWTQMQKEWLEFLKANEGNYSADEWWKLQGITKVLRYNWDAAKHWRQENRLTAAIRLGIDLSLLGLEGKENKEPPTKMSEEYIREKGLEEYMKSKAEPECPTHESTDIDDANFEDEEDNDDGMGILGDFVDVDLKPRVNDRRRLKDNEASINTRNNSFRFTFNQAVSKEIKSRGGYEYAALLRNKQGDCIIKLNDEKGVSVQDGSRNRENSNVVIHSQTLVGKLVDFLGVEREYNIVNVKEVAKTDDFVAYLVTKI